MAISALLDLGRVRCFSELYDRKTKFAVSTSTSMMDNLIAYLPATRIVALALGVLVIELVAISVLFQRTGRGISFADMVGSVFAGIFLMLALLAALTSGNWYLIVAALSAAFLAHVVDLKRRWHS